MVKTTFLYAIYSLTNIVEQMRKLYNMGIDIMESPLVTNAEDLAMLLLSEYYNEEGMDWIQWWVYEKSENPHIVATDEQGNKILKNIDELYDYLEANCKTK